MIKIDPGMEAGTAICLYVIFSFFQAAQSIMHYLYFRFWLSTKNCIKILIDISLLFALSLVWSYLLAGEENCKSHQNRLLLQEKNEKLVIVWFLPRIISQGLSASLEAKVLSWLYVQLHEAHNCNADSILSIDRVIPKGIW